MDQVGLLSEATEKLAELGGLEAARAIGGPDGEQEALPREHPPVGLRHR